MATSRWGTSRRDESRHYVFPDGVLVKFAILIMTTGLLTTPGRHKWRRYEFGSGYGCDSKHPAIPSGGEPVEIERFVVDREDFDLLESRLGGVGAKGAGAHDGAGFLRRF